MKLKLFHKLFLLVAVTGLIASLAMATVMAWNLSRGFADYLDARDAETLEAYVGLISQELAEQGGIEALEAGQITLKSVHGDMVREGLIPSRTSTLGPEGRPPRRPDKRFPDEGPGQRRPPPRGIEPPNFLAPRLLLFDASGEKIAGPPPPQKDGPKMMARAITLNGENIGTAKIIPHGPTPGGVDARFLRSQYVNAALLVVALMVFAALAAWGFARAGTRRLANMESATKEIANGNFNVRADSAGTDEVSTMGENINLMAESLARSDQARRGWLAEIGHELRTPLTVLRGELDALKDGIRPLDQSAITSLQEETGRLGELIEDLHFMAVSDLSDAPSTFGPYAAVKLIEDVTERFRPLLLKAGLNMRVNLGHQTSLPVIWDGKRIEHLLGNLLTNALRYTDAPGMIQIDLKRAGDFVTISVADSAPGVPAGAISRLFEPLFRIDEARDRTSGGSGLGLAVCKTIAEAHGGGISARISNLGGLLIELNLPLEAPQP
ncbi:ATP-binding protein [uncultured Parasphingorhabdus sp.]|uniref:ATP-binding protein n=1 Tax=uncultured Parasphingorhabdus sp. TaxID=2709694 RepID=UPI0030D8423E|tara:strand:- start:24128 stop:25615 length:1488 start_codon:yes stop_codon:yes gene_type:complete